MAISVSQAFKRTSKNPIDETMALTQVQMRSVNDNTMPDRYFTICQDDGAIYLYSKANTADPTTGKFRKFEGGSGAKSVYYGYLKEADGKFYDDSAYTTEIAGAEDTLYVTKDTDKTYRYDSTNGFVLVSGGDGETIQYDTMPTASSELVGTIVQYVGSTTATYTKGYWYECVLDGATYKWQNIQVQEGGGESGSGISVTATLLAASWDAQNQQTVTFTGYQASMNGVIGVPASATDAQKEAYASALIRTVAQNGNQFTFECESIPSIDLPVTIYAGGSSGSGTGGHTIIDDAGQDMTARDGLQFVGATVTDDSTNNKTVVTIPNGGHTIVDGNGNDMTKRDDLQFVGMSVTDDAVNGRTVVTLDPSIYKPAGDKTSAELISSLLVVENLGNVYNITTAGTTTADFVGGAGNPISIGDNVVIVDVGSGTYKFDLLGGFVDLSGKADKVSSATNGDFAGLDTNGNLTDSGKKASDFATPENVQDSINTSADLLKDTVGWTGKNLLKNTATTQTINGVTFTVNADGSVTANGTATTQSSLTILGTFTLKRGSYIMSGCPAGGSNTTYQLFMNIDNTDANMYREYGNGIDITVDTDTVVQYGVAIVIRANAVINNLTFYPMLRDASITDDTYEPYHESVEVMYEEEIHGVNLLKNTVTTQTVSGVTFTVNSDGTITANGTATSDIIETIGIFNYVPESLTLTGCPSNGAWNTYRLDIRNENNIQYGNYLDTGNGVTFTPDENYTYVCLRIGNGTTVSNIVFKPMLRKADIEDSTYHPYNEQAIQNQLNAQGVLGAKNLLQNTATSQTINGVTVTVDDNKVITLNGTSTEDSYIRIFATSDLNSVLAKYGDLILNGSHPTEYTKARMIARYGTSNYVVDLGKGVLLSSAITYEMGITLQIYKNNTFTNHKVYPMLRLASDPDNTYQPYAMTNKELTEFAINKMGRQLPLVNLGTEYTAELKADISSGKFEKAVVGGYLTINGHVYYFAHPDYWLRTGDTECTTHHMLVIPAGNIGTGKMNDTNITTSGYAGSDMKTGNNANTALATARAQIIADFGAANILTHREMFTTAVTDGKASNWAWSDSDIDLMNEAMVYGCSAWASHPGYETGIDKCQLKLFQERPDLITTRAGWWLRSVVSATGFAFVYNNGCANRDNASNAHGVRPAFAIIG